MKIDHEEERREFKREKRLEMEELIEEQEEL